MSQEVTVLMNESKQLICDSLAKISEIIGKSDAVGDKVAPPREVPLFFPRGIGSITLTVKVTNVGELTFTISGENAAKPALAESPNLERNLIA